MPKSTKPQNRFNVSQLAEKFEIPRMAVRARLKNFTPHETTSTGTWYVLTDEMAEALQGEDAGFEAEKLRKMTAEADIKEMEAAERRGELAPVAEFTETVQALFSGMYREMTVRLPKKIAGKLSRAKSSAQVATLLQREIAGVFDDLRSDFTQFLGNGANGRKA